MSDTGERTFTLDEAREELARRECSEDGHDWEVITVRVVCEAFDRPVSVVCRRCREARAVEAAS